MDLIVVLLVGIQLGSLFERLAQWRMRQLPKPPFRRNDDEPDAY
jgi:hypothetical protein